MIAAPAFQADLADCIEWLQTIEDRTVDLIVCDSAYASLEKHRAIGTTTRLTADWFEVIPNERWPELMRECYRVLKKDSHAYFIADEETTYDVTKPAAKAAGFEFRKALTWVKTKEHGLEAESLEPEDVSIGMGYSWRASSERIAFLRKGNRQLLHLGWPDVLPYRAIRATERRYATEKPVPLLERLIANSTDSLSPNEPPPLVIDPFMGSGSTGEAALRLGRRFAGCDIAARAVELTRDRLSRLSIQDPVDSATMHVPTEAVTITARAKPAQGSLFGA